MPSAICSCGQTVEGPAGDGACPACGGVVEIPAEKIRFACACGARLSAPAKLIGKAVDCPGCGQPATVPARSEAPPAPGTVRKQALPARRWAAPPPKPDPCWMVWTRYALALALLPLLVSLLVPDEDVIARAKRMIQEDPSLAKVFQNHDLDTALEMLPHRRLDGAALARTTWLHWLMALISAMFFWLFILVAWPMGAATSRQLWVLGLFTGTVGIFLLLAIQWIGLHFHGWVLPHSVLGILFIVIQFIGFSYRAALDPANGFFPSMFGFTMGVGLCEEACKALPLFFLARGRSTLDARGLALLGLATGIGFGVSEGITYSSHYYNGLTGGWIYVVRFVSCVALHAVWSASSGLMLWRSHAEIESVGSWYGWFLPLFKVIGLSMILHGLYDTCLKRDMELSAFGAAMLSFAWFSWLYERTIREERRGVLSPGFRVLA